MDYCRALIAAFLAASSGAACAGYAWPADPPGFTRSGAWGSGYGYAAGANDSTFGKIIHQPNGLKYSVNGRAVTMPVSYRLAQNAPRFAAAAIFAHPGISTAVGIASWLGLAGLVWDSVNQVWKRGEQEYPQSLGLEFQGYGGSWFHNPEDACATYKNYFSDAFGPPYSMEGGNVDQVGSRYVCRLQRLMNGQFNLSYDRDLQKRGSSCPVGWYLTPAGCVQTPPPKTVTQQEFEDILAPKPMPETVPKELPYPTPLPVEPSPGPWVNPEPGTNPQHRPLFVPTGDPVPNPNYDPNAEPGPNNQPWIQPGTKLNPSPVLNDPFRLDVKPVDRPKPTPDPMAGPEPESDPNQNPNDKPKEEKSDLCQDHPDIVACQKLGDLSPENLAEKTVTLQFEKSSGFGPENGSCPAPKEFMVLGKQMAFRWDLLCDFASGIRPLLIGFAYLSAALAFLGLSRKDS